MTPRSKRPIVPELRDAHEHHYEHFMSLHSDGNTFRVEKCSCGATRQRNIYRKDNAGFPMTARNQPQITSLEKLVSLVKGEILGKLLTESEYYYLMFGCKNGDDIALIKSMTLDECKYFLDCCWYLGIEHPAMHQLEFIKMYRKFPNRSATKADQRIKDVIVELEKRDTKSAKNLPKDGVCLTPSELRADERCSTLRDALAMLRGKGGGGAEAMSNNAINKSPTPHERKHFRKYYTDVEIMGCWSLSKDVKNKGHKISACHAGTCSAYARCKSLHGGERP